ncbi:MAG: glycoside hydrolase family 43, partial [Ruminococcus sp.]|nr:glycoside hydrolase family 43 [Ruminococcus sp.]
GETQYDTIAEATAIKGEWVQLANKNYKIPSDASNMQIYVETAESTNNFYIDEAIGAIAGTTILGAGESKNIILGDINSDGVINSFDMVLARNGLINGFSESSEKLSADVDQNGEYNISDAVLIQKFILGQINEFPVSEPVTPPTPPSSDMLTMSEYTPMVQAKVSEFETDASKQEKAGVQYGTVKSGTYYSTTCNRNKPYNILLPANYNENKKYPVLYVLHGYYENQDRMIIEGNGTMYTRQIIGNAIAEGEAEDMIVVFPYVYSSATQDACSGSINDENNAAYDNFINDLTKDLMPHIESTYSVKTGRENTAITGFSMGGRESLLIGMQRADLFGYVGAICPAPGVTGSFKWDSEKEAPSLLFITGGSNDTVVYSNPENYHNNFAQNNVPHIWHYVNGGYHGDNSIHAHIYNFVRAVFKA